MLISHKHKFIFLHPNKCAGTSIGRSLIPHLGPEDIILGYTEQGEKYSVGLRKTKLIWKHCEADRVKELVFHWDYYFKFTIVRNPWARVVSSYHWRKKKHYINENKSFNEFVRNSINTIPHCHEFTNGVDFVGKVENIEEDFKKICEKIGIEVKLKHENKTKHKSYWRYYDEETIEIVRKEFSRDIDLFYSELAVPGH